MWKIIIPKIAVLVFLKFIAHDIITVFDGAFTMLFLISGILSLIIGSIALFSQWNIKRFIAYSSISHVGFLLLA
jgi:NADH:ubiquinone oxidoreductase subunit 2 (subunit N)